MQTGGEMIGIVDEYVHQVTSLETKQQDVTVLQAYGSFTSSWHVMQ